MLNEEKEKNINDKKIILELNEKITNLKNESKNISNIENKKLTEQLLLKEKEINDLKEIYSGYPFEFKKGEKLMSIMFNSLNQSISYSLICKNTDVFDKVVNLLYDKYPEYKKYENSFFYNGTKINQQLTIEQNGIEDGGKIILYKE